MRSEATVGYNSDMADTRELRRRIKRKVDAISADRLGVAYDFLDYLESRETDAATSELLAIPGLIDAVREADEDGEKSAKSWRKVRNDV